MTTPMQNITKVTIEFGSGETLVMEPGMEVDFILGVATNVQRHSWWRGRISSAECARGRWLTSGIAVSILTRGFAKNPDPVGAG